MFQVSLVILVIVIVIISASRRRTTMSAYNVKNITSQEAKELIDKNEDTLILDVRTKAEYISGHIPNAKLIPLNQLTNSIDDLDQYKDKPVIIYCATGGRSPIAVNILVENGFSNINHLYRGISNWKYDVKK